MVAVQFSCVVFVGLVRIRVERHTNVFKKLSEKSSSRDIKSSFQSGCMPVIW
jgi:hypothetical protein